MLTAQEKRTIEGLRKTDLNDLKNISLLLALTQNILKRNDDTNIDYCMKLTAFVKDKCKAIIPNVEPYVAEEYAKQYWFAVKIESRYKFESFIEFMEKNRPYEKKFYAPRRRTLKQVADELQNLEDGKYKFLGISMPSRTGKSTMCIFFLAWISCKRPNSHNAMGGHSGILAKSFYQELLNLILTEEYAFAELYDYMNPGYFKRGIPTSKSADTFTITLGSPDRFATVTCRGSDGTWTGAVDVSKDGYLYIDDLVRDREHSLSPQRMENTFQEYLNKMVDRKNEGARELMVGTLWNVMDPLERIRKQFEGNPDYKFLKIPALNEKDESNFDYDINGFSTQYYREMRERLDNAEWMAKYQQMPFVREGLLFPSDELRRFDGTLNFKKRGLIAVIDPAIGKGDNLSMPICAWDKDDPSKRYIIDWVYTKETTKFSVPKCVDKIIKHSIPEVHIERDGIGEVVYKELKDEIARRGVMCKIVPKHSSNKLDKENKIQGCSDYIKDNFYFLDDKTVNDNNEAEFLVTQEYRNALADTTFYTSTGKNKNDDAPDSLAQLSIIFHPLQENGIVEAAFNPFRRFMGGYYDIY